MSINRTVIERLINFVADKTITFVFKEKELDFKKVEFFIKQTNFHFELVKEGKFLIYIIMLLIKQII